MELLSKCFFLLCVSSGGVVGFSIWDPLLPKNLSLGDAATISFYSDFEEGCWKDSYQAFGDFLPLDFYLNCWNFNGSVSCQVPPGDDIFGTCGCNLQDDAYFEKDLNIVDAPRCLSKVGALCTAEHSSFVPDKICTPNADCIPEAANSSIGACKCRKGFKETASTRRCESDGGVTEAPRTTTTQQPGNPGNIKLPPLDLFLRFSTVYGGHCGMVGNLLPLNHSYCNTYQRTVACVRDVTDAEFQQCACSMRKDSIFDADFNMCVGLAGSYCLARGNILGYKICTDGADCLTDGSFEDGYSFGTCECLYGYNEQTNGTCLRDPTITNPSTPRNIVTSQATTPPTSTRPTGNPGGGGGNDGASGLSPFFSQSILALLAILSYFIASKA